MILIADSGATKVDWRCIQADGSIVEIQTEGINAVYLTADQIIDLLKKHLLPVLGNGVREVYFYGAGVVSAEVSKVLADCFDAVFPGCTCVAESDILAAARALCGNKPGIACILGTGANTCFYDGEQITKNVRAGGFILGDDGSGAVIGKHFISDFIKGLLPKEIEDEFVKRYGLDYMAIVQKVYREGLPSRFLASFSPFINEFRAHPHIAKLLRRCFDDFCERNISQYDYENYEVNLVGSVAHYYRDILEESAKEHGMRIGKILKSPISGLVEYHN
ncbi:MAG: ATPase [Bacteroidales bacterium]|nr:ATPase [Bacteroidales bacterium]